MSKKSLKPHWTTSAVLTYVSVSESTVLWSVLTCLWSPVTVECACTCWEFKPSLATGGT